MIVIPPVELVIPDDILYTNVPADIVPPASPEDEMRYQMFAPISNKLTESLTYIYVIIKPRERWNTLMFFNVGADRVVAEIKNGPTEWTHSELLFYPEPLGEIKNKPNLCIVTPDVDPEIYPDARIEVRLSVNYFRPIFCELMAVGWRYQIGQTCYQTSLGMVDYSRKDRAFDGSVTIVERGYSDTVNFKFEIETDTIGQARELLTSRRAKPTGYIGNLASLETFIFGLYKDFTIPIESYTYSFADLFVDSVVRTGGDIVTGISGLQAYFTDPELDVYSCLEDVETQGIFKKLYIDAEGSLGTQKARIMVPLSRHLVSGETVEWNVIWEDELSGELSVSEQLIITTCDQQIAVYTIYASSGTFLNNVAVISLTFTDVNQTGQVSNAVSLMLTDEAIPCTNLAWWNEETEAYDKSAVYGVVAPKDVRALATVFDADYYLLHNPDVVAAIAAGTFDGPYMHYYHYGDAENRKPNAWFDPAYYKANNPDVVDKTYPNQPNFFHTVFQHYQMWGYGEGRLPCSTATLTAIDSSPVGEFYWHARLTPNNCTLSGCEISFNYEFSGENVPKIEITEDTVIVCAEVVAGDTELLPVSAGVLTVTPIIQCPADSEELPLPDPVLLEPITLTLLQFFTGWETGSGLEWVVTSSSLTGVWTAKVVGDLTECVVQWAVSWAGDQSQKPDILANSNTGTLHISNVTSGGVIEAQATVTGRHGSITLEKIFLRLGDYEFVPPLISCPNPLWLNGTNTEVGFVEEIQEIE